MFKKCQKEQADGRLPPTPQVEFFHVQIPKEKDLRLLEARRAASKEVTRDSQT